MLASVRRAAILTMLLVVVAAGCGGGTKTNGEETKSAAQVVADAQRAAVNASSVHIRGHITDNGTPLTIDLTLVKGKGGKGSLSERGAGFQVIRLGDVIYVKGSAAFLKRFAGAAAASLLHDRWLKAPATSGRLAALSPLTDAEQLFKAALGQHGKLANRGATDFEGRQVVQIEDTTQGGKLYVAATGDPLPVALRGSAQQGSVDFSDWNADATVEAPKGAIDLNALGG